MEVNPTSKGNSMKIVMQFVVLMLSIFMAVGAVYTATTLDSFGGALFLGVMSMLLLLAWNEMRE
jgi:hypothetical protein